MFKSYFLISVNKNLVLSLRSIIISTRYVKNIKITSEITMMTIYFQILVQYHNEIPLSKRRNLIFTKCQILRNWITFMTSGSQNYPNPSVIYSFQKVLWLLRLLAYIGRDVIRSKNVLAVGRLPYIQIFLILFFYKKYSKNGNEWSFAQNENSNKYLQN